jgi:non-ribosomal peptide synthetase component F
MVLKSDIGHADRHLCARFEDRVAEMPSQPAVGNDDTGWLSFANLDSAAGTLAAELVQRGIQPQTRVGVCVPRSPASVVAVLAVWKAGATYVPVETNASVDHTEAVLRHAAVELVLTTSDSAGPALSGFDLLFIDTVTQHADRDAGFPTVPASGEDIAWILYTSGSTGRPKGVMGPHRALTRRCAWMWKSYPFGPGEVSVQNTQLTVVDSYWELWGSLAQGVRVVLPPHDAFKDPDRLVDLLAAHHVTRICVVPSMLRALLDVVDSLGERLPKL